MRILFVNPRAYLPQLLGGVETTTYDLCRQLILMGHLPAVMCQIWKHDPIWLRNRLANRLTGRAFPRGQYRGTLVYRGYQHKSALDEVIADFRPDALVVASGHEDSFELAAQCARSRLPSAIYFHDVKSLRELDSPKRLAGLILLANSSFTAQAVRKYAGQEAVLIPPPVDREAYRIVTSRRHVTMVNPRRVKGGQIAFDLAQACPDIPFMFVEAWHTKDEFVGRLRAAARHMRNVTWRKPTPDMQSIYSGTRIQLVPSECETWGRVVTEAQAAGIPALATAAGALPESVGPGGILVEPLAPITDWIRALRSMWDNHTLYETLSNRAREHSDRPAAQPSYLAAAFVAALQSGGASGAQSLHA